MKKEEIKKTLASVAIGSAIIGGVYIGTPVDKYKIKISDNLKFQTIEDYENHKTKTINLLEKGLNDKISLEELNQIMTSLKDISKYEIKNKGKWSFNESKNLKDKVLNNLRK